VKPTPEAVARLAEESEAGPATLPTVRDLEANRTKVPNSDEAIPLVKKAYKNKQPKGSASNALEAAFEATDDRLAADLQALNDYLTSPDIALLPPNTELKNDELKDLLAEANNLPELIKALDNLNEDGQRFNSLPDLVEGVGEYNIAAQKAKQDLQRILEDPNNGILDSEDGGLTSSQVDGIHDQVDAGLDAPSYLNELLAEGNNPPTGIDGATNALKDITRKKKKEKKQDKEKLRDYLQDPTCPLFTPTGNKNKDITPAIVNEFFGLEKSGPGVGALLNALEESGKQADSVPDLLTNAKALSDGRKRELQAKLDDPNSTLLNNLHEPVTANDAKALAKESTAGPAAAELLKQLEKAGLKKEMTQQI